MMMLTLLFKRYGNVSIKLHAIHCVVSPVFLMYLYVSQICSFLF